MALTLVFVIAILIGTMKQKKGKQYLISHFKELKQLSKKYSCYAEKYIQNILKLNKSYFCLTVNGAHNAFVEKNRSKFSGLLQKILKYDGFETYKAGAIYETDIKEAWKITELFSIEVKTKITTNKDWKDSYTLPCLIYFIVREYILTTSDSKFIPNGKQNAQMESRILQNESYNTFTAKKYELESDAITLKHAVKTNVNKQPTLISNKIKQEQKEPSKPVDFVETKRCCNNCGGIIMFDEKGNGICPYCYSKYKLK